MPWRETTDPYKIWVSEVILQQTQIKTGIKYYNKFLEKFPNIITLASSEDLEILKIWEGLGYYNRALNMLYSARTIVKYYNGVFPTSYNQLIKLKGIGEYTASAISSICANEKRGVVDGNVYRVLSRLYNIKEPIDITRVKQNFQKLANKLVPSENPGTYNQAIMDFGSTHCTKHNPSCHNCIFKKKCESFKENVVLLRPVKKIKKSYIHRHLNYLFITKSDNFIIQQRGVNDVWKKLYELPLIETKKQIDKDFLMRQNYLKKFQISNIRLQYSMQHNLSHQKLKIYFWEIIVQDINIESGLKKITLNTVSLYPFPRPLTKYFETQHNLSI